LAPEALTRSRNLARFASGLIAIALSLASLDAYAARHARHGRPHLPPPPARALPYPSLELPLQISGGQYAPLAWSEISGWNDDDHLAGYNAFRISCKPIAAQTQPSGDAKALGISLRDPCRIAKALDVTERAKAKAFFEEHFLPLRISRLGEG